MFMPKQPQSLLHILQHALHMVSHAAIVAATLALVAASLAASFGALPWPELTLRWGGYAVAQAGIYAQLGLTALMAMICFFLPANARMARLEQSHRLFQLSMDDVRQAYAAVHAADRRSVFTLSSEFEEMRARMDYMRQHPDLSHLEPELLEIAAQMSLQSRDLARIYSADKVERARTFLRQRQQEVAQTEERLSLARTTCAEIRRWMQDIEAGERETSRGLRALESDLRDILPLLGYDVDDMRDANVVALPKPATHPGTAPHKQ
jgi:hypothetical protein